MKQADAQAYEPSDMDDCVYVDAQDLSADARFAQEDADKFWRLSQKHLTASRNPNLKSGAFGPALANKHAEASRLFSNAATYMEYASKAYKKGNFDEGENHAVHAGRMVNKAEQIENLIERNQHRTDSARADSVRHYGMDNERAKADADNPKFIDPRLDSYGLKVFNDENYKGWKVFQQQGTFKAHDGEEHDVWHGHWEGEPLQNLYVHPLTKDIMQWRKQDVLREIDNRMPHLKKALEEKTKKNK